MKATKKTAAVTPAADASEKKKALATALSQIQRDFGTGAVMRLGENAHMEVQAVHTGSISLDMALGIGGLPRGRIVEIFGPESSGKTTVALHIVAEVQKCPVVAVATKDYISSSTAVSTVGAAVGYVLCTVQVRRTATSATRTAIYLHIVNKV